MVANADLDTIVSKHDQTARAAGSWRVQSWQFVKWAGGCSFSAFSDASRGKVPIKVVSGINRVRLLEASQNYACQFHAALQPNWVLCLCFWFNPVASSIIAYGMMLNLPACLLKMGRTRAALNSASPILVAIALNRYCVPNWERNDCMCWYVFHHVYGMNHDLYSSNKQTWQYPGVLCRTQSMP